MSRCEDDCVGAWMDERVSESLRTLIRTYTLTHSPSRADFPHTQDFLFRSKYTMKNKYCHHICSKCLPNFTSTAKIKSVFFRLHFSFSESERERGRER
jgi:hypothetical protein